MRTCDKEDDDAPESCFTLRVNAGRSSSPWALVGKKRVRLWEAPEGWGCDLPPRQQQRLERACRGGGLFTRWPAFSLGVQAWTGLGAGNSVQAAPSGPALSFDGLSHPVDKHVWKTPHRMEGGEANKVPSPRGFHLRARLASLAAIARAWNWKQLHSNHIKAHPHHQLICRQVTQ